MPTYKDRNTVYELQPLNPSHNIFFAMKFTSSWMYLTYNPTQNEELFDNIQFKGVYDTWS